MESLILATLIGLGIGIVLPGKQRKNFALSDQINHRIAELERKVNLLLANLGTASDVSPAQEYLILEAVPPRQRIKVIKVIRKLTKLDLVAAKNLVDSTPSLIPTLHTDLHTAKAELAAAGARVSLKSKL
jgi:ribosomal protein L7/L12